MPRHLRKARVSGEDVETHGERQSAAQHDPECVGHSELFECYHSMEDVDERLASRNTIKQTADELLSVGDAALVPVYTKWEAWEENLAYEQLKGTDLKGESCCKRRQYSVIVLVVVQNLRQSLSGNVNVALRMSRFPLSFVICVFTSSTEKADDARDTIPFSSSDILWSSKYTGGTYPPGARPACQASGCSRGGMGYRGKRTVFAAQWTNLVNG